MPTVAGVESIFHIHKETLAHDSRSKQLWLFNGNFRALPTVNTNKPIPWFDPNKSKTNLHAVHIISICKRLGPMEETEMQPMHAANWWQTAATRPAGSGYYYRLHYSDVKLSAAASPITGFSIVCSTVSSGADQRKHQSSASLAVVRGIHRWPVNSPYKGPVTRKMLPFDDVIMVCHACNRLSMKQCWPGSVTPYVTTRLMS